jgi:D-alanyl-D-alanine carboxypeptidase
LLGTIDLSGQPRFAAIDQGLAVAGESGTLATRLGSDPLRGVLRAKTGHIDGVAALAGVIDRSPPLRFAFVTNGQFSVAQGEALQDVAARLVATYPQVPARSVVPAPGP